MKLIRKSRVMAFVMLFAILFSTVCYAEYYTQSEIEELIDRIAMERGVPSVIIKSIAKLESNLSQFKANGTPVVSPSGYIGVMQVGNSSGIFDTQKLKYDIEYNINAGIDVLLIKWNTSLISKRVSKIGDMNPSILENWYFAIWAYNSWAGRNNPNASSRAYQERVFDVSESRYNQPINSISASLLPASGVPTYYAYETPNAVNYTYLMQYKKDDLVEVVSVLNDRYLYSEPGGAVVSKINNGQIAEIIEEPVFHNGYYWYMLKTQDNIVGWTQRNWLKKVGNNTYGLFPFKDITYHWCADTVMNLYSQGIINGKSATAFNPDDSISREEFISLYARIFNLKSSEETELRFVDKDKVGAWAVNSINAVDEFGLLGMYGENINPKLPITRGEITYMIGNHLRKLPEYSEIDLSTIELAFEDVVTLQDWQNDLIKLSCLSGVISGQNSTTFNYNGTITRGAAASVLSKLQNFFIEYEDSQEVLEENAPEEGGTPEIEDSEDGNTEE